MKAMCRCVDTVLDCINSVVSTTTYIAIVYILTVARKFIDFMFRA